MREKDKYMPPGYVPLDQSAEDDGFVPGGTSVDTSRLQIMHEQAQWSSGICACCDDVQSCCIGSICPCFLFGKNAEFMGADSWIGPCIIHFIACGLGCMLTDGLLLGLPGSVVACYACNYRRALRRKYNLPEAPCGDFVTHICCHLCAICQEYREIRERSGSNCSHADLNISAITAPPAQSMESITRQP